MRREQDNDITIATIETKTMLNTNIVKKESYNSLSLITIVFPLRTPAQKMESDIRDSAMQECARKRAL